MRQSCPFLLRPSVCPHVRPKYVSPSSNHLTVCPSVRPSSIRPSSICQFVLFYNIKITSSRPFIHHSRVKIVRFLGKVFIKEKQMHETILMTMQREVKRPITPRTHLISRNAFRLVLFPRLHPFSVCNKERKWREDDVFLFQLRNSDDDK